LAAYLRLSVITPEQVVLEVDGARRVRMRLADEAWLSVYPNHAPLVAEVLPGPLQYDTELETGELHVGSSIVYVDSNVVTVLTSGQREDRDVQAVPESAQDQRFDRLARELMQALEAQQGTVIPEASVDAETQESWEGV
jgi:F0F1-type ATP synthase epsilon subunit